MRIIRSRDGYICQSCGKLEVEEWRKLSIHHIDHVKENIKHTNLITVCSGCNTRANYNRPYWIKFYTEKLREKILL